MFGRNNERRFTLCGIGMVRGSKARRNSLIAVAAIAGAALLAGCGGGSSSNGGNNGGTTRSAAITAVRGARGASTRLALNPSDFVGQTEGLTRKVNALRRQQPTDSELSFDEDYGLWTRLGDSGSEDTLKILYFRDQNGTQPAGSFTLKFEGDPEALPLTIRLNFEITAGKEPGRGTSTIVLNSENTGTFKGTFTDLQTGETVTFDLVFTENGTTAGEFTIAEDDQQYKFKDIVLQEDGRMVANIEATGLTGAIGVNADESGTLTLTTAQGQTTANWNAAGVGTVRLPNGSVLNVADFDTAQ
jgi:hypothetical protein